MGFLDRMVARDARTDDRGPLDKRLAVIPTPDLPLWADNVLSQTGKHLQQFLRDGDRDALEEAKLGAESLVSLIQELERLTAKREPQGSNLGLSASAADDAMGDGTFPHL
jgi:hypothetical protein